MQKYGYDSYEDYRYETNARPPRTLEAHRRKLTGTLAATEDGSLTLDLYRAVLDMTQASEPVRAVVCSVLTYSKEKPRRSGRALEVR